MVIRDIDSELGKPILMYRFYPQQHRSFPAAYEFVQEDVEKSNSEGFQESCEPQNGQKLSKSEKKKLKFEERTRQKEARQLVQQERAEVSESNRQMNLRRKVANMESKVEKPLATPETFAWFHHPSWGAGAGLTARPGPRQNAEMDEWVKGEDPATAVITLLKDTDPSLEVVRAGVQRLELQWLFTPILQISNTRKQLDASDWQNFHVAAAQAMKWLLAGE